MEVDHNKEASCLCVGRYQMEEASCVSVCGKIPDGGSFMCVCVWEDTRWRKLHVCVCVGRYQIEVDRIKEASCVCVCVWADTRWRLIASRRL